MGSKRTVRITVGGLLSDRLATAFDGMTAVRRGGATDLVGELVDQAHLHGLLARIRDLGLALESVTVSEADPSEADPSDAHPPADGPDGLDPADPTGRSRPWRP